MNPGTDQHASSPEAHHTQAALEREAVVVCGCDAWLEGLGSADAVSFLGLPFRVMHPLHVLPEFVFSLKLFPTGGTQEVLAVRMPEHVQPQLVGAAEGLVTLGTLVDLLRVEASHVLFHLVVKTRGYSGQQKGPEVVMTLEGANTP